jgi:hypothetical protein
MSNIDPAPTLPLLLARLPARHLRAIVTRLGLRQRSQASKADWGAAIARFWHAPLARQPHLDALSPAAREALARLLQSDTLPAVLFWAEYGVVRHAGQPPGVAPPWRSPGNPSEELYYLGLLHPADHPRLGGCTRLCLPADLRQPLAALLPPAAPPVAAAPSQESWRHARRLCHDLAQLLIYLYERSLPTEAPLRRQHGRWLAPRDLLALHERLLTPEPARPPWRSHRQTHYLRLLMFLAAAADFHAAGSLTPVAWAWLAAPFAQQLRQLWQAWVTAPPELRTAYAMPCAQLPAPWPLPLLDLLRSHERPARAAALAARLLHQQPGLHPYWTYHLDNLAALDDLLAELCAGPLALLGIVAPTGERRNPAWQLTACGHWLLHTAGAPPDPPASAAPAALLTAAGPALALTIPADASYHAHARLAPFTRFGRLANAGGDESPTGNEPVMAGESGESAIRPYAHHIRLLDGQSVAGAAAAGLGLAQLLAALDSMGAQRSPEHGRLLHSWHEAGGQLAVYAAPLLRTARPEQLARLCQDAHTKALIAEVLSPTTALLDRGPAAAAALLRRAGYAVQVWDIDPRDPAPGAEAALWLAGRLYALLGEHAPLPLPPPFASLDALFAQLPESQQAVLSAYLSQVHQALIDLLDGRTFTPPPNPSDPQQWLPMLENALAREPKPWLDLEYWVAGRGLLTARTVQPQWLETHDNTLYLRAFCQSAQRVILFRLDRIQRIAVSEP